MKKFKYTIWACLALVMTLGANSCGSLEEEPVGILSPEAIYRTPADVANGVNGGYSLVGHEGFWGRKLSMSLMLRGDMVSIGDQTTSSRRIEVDQMSMSSNNGMVSAFWPKGYEILAAVNYAIEGAKNVEADEDDINPIVAEARFLRAFVHYNFVRLFGEIPYIDFAFSDPDLAYSLPQTSEAEVYTGIIEDLEYAKQWLPDVPMVRSRPGKGTAAGFLASVHLTLGNWQNAYDEAKYVIDNSGAFQYGLETDYSELFNPAAVESSDEVLFEVSFIGGDASGNPGSLGGTNAAIDYLASVTGPRGDERFELGEGWSVAVPTIEVFNTWSNQDYRHAVSFDTLLVYEGVETPYTDWGAIARNVPRPHIAKYFRAVGESGLPAGSNGRDSELDFPVMRYAEVLLTAAEALNEINGGPNAEAEGYVNQVRSRARRELDGDASNDRTVPANVNSGLGQDAFRDLVLDDRRLELAFEGVRWFDIKRRNLGVQAFGASGLEQQNFDPARDYYFPKYQADVDRNENLFQNDGY
ncbi:RagB/SusD family nutrient uptake outer membrane protein [Reichenbachiella ulvae]|uniref:RagB/SusD family nutrient uptake outer membrane protein n=1 Tax=Reichenbachiella ulvae TaxID=2980104 RepID=A0ABT3CUF0_9BACT|nr:RagB/SusD family nutrient uptake outer membrane protein [Reichenbachiella ulvae]MCV9387303.1 RagB/SusD family nutrient uptake outer membrane protein [Reichenbachiella ulvae]